MMWICAGYTANAPDMCNPESHTIVTLSRLKLLCGGFPAPLAYTLTPAACSVSFAFCYLRSFQSWFDFAQDSMEDTDRIIGMETQVQDRFSTAHSSMDIHTQLYEK
eukprot:SAG31_NODE_2044_length_6580_cov_2.757445_6_plen_106_part_00